MRRCFGMRLQVSGCCKELLENIIAREYSQNPIVGREAAERGVRRMAKQVWKPGNLLNPVPVVMVSVAGADGGANIITVAWAGTVCTNPPMVSISVRPSRYSYHKIEETGEFVINLTNRALVRACDYCGVASGRDVDKFRKMNLTPLPMAHVRAPGIAESPVNIECRVKELLPLGSHTMFVAEVAGVAVEDAFLDENGRLGINESGLVMYSHGEYFAMGEKLGSFGFSVRKSKTKKRKRKWPSAT